MNKLIESLPTIAAIVITIIVVGFVWNSSYNKIPESTKPTGSKEMPLVDVN